MKVLLLVALMTAPPSALAAGEPGKPAPSFTLPDSDGKRRSLAESKGKFVVLEWFDHECPSTDKHYRVGAMQALQTRYAKLGVDWYAIASSAPGKQGWLPPKLARKIRTTMLSNAKAVLLDPDGKVGRLYSAKTTPHMFVINPKGVIIYMGAIDNTYQASLSENPDLKNHVAAALDEALTGKPVTTPYIPAYGCAVKY